jgi:peroxiredoxin
VRARGGELLAISGDSPWCHEAFTKARGFSFPLLSDVHRRVITAYGMLDAERNVAWRSTFVIDAEGNLRPPPPPDRLMVRDGTEILRVLEVACRK